MEELIKIISECDFVVSMRYHATLISNMLGKNTLCIDLSEEHRHYKNKNDNLYNSYGFAENRILLGQLPSYTYSTFSAKNDKSKSLVIEAIKQSAEERHNIIKAISTSFK